MMAYGGPDSLDDVEPYLLDVRSGRPTTPEFVEEIRGRYALIGGRSPLLERTREQAAALERALGIPVYVGMRHWRPFIADVFETMVRDGITDVTALPMAPHFSKISVGAYHKRVEEARTRAGANVDVRFVRSWSTEPLFLEAVAAKVRAALPAGHVVFTAHSLPQAAVVNDDSYRRECVARAEEVARRGDVAEWTWAFQSQGGTREGWLGPDLRTTLDGLRDKGIRDVLIVPIGFVCDHVEVLYDVDIEAKQYAESKGMTLRRSESLNASPQFITALAEIVRTARLS